MNLERKEIINELKSMVDNDYREFHSGLCPGTNNILGIRVPVLRKYAKKLAKEEGQDILKILKDEYYEEIMLQGMLIGILKLDLETRLNHLESFIPKIDNWAVCDITCAGLKFTEKSKETVWDFLQKYLNSSKEFEVRFGIVMLLDYYITDEYIDRVIKILNNTICNKYYIRMAVAWIISVLYVNYPSTTLEFLKSKENKLDNETYNKALQKIIESNRVSKKEKNAIRNLKRRNVN